MPPKPVILSTRSFANQGKATEFFSAMLNRYTRGARVNDEDALDLSALLERHPERDAKIGVGVDHFEVMLTEHGTNCFRLVRIDGSGTDFSIGSCVRKCAPSIGQQVNEAFRYAIRYDLYDARDQFFAEHVGVDRLVACAETGERIRREDGHMDHRPPVTFEVIVKSFLASRNMRPENVPITTGRDDQVTPKLTDDELRDSFRAYHKRMAKLDFIKAKINLSQSSRNRIKPTRIEL